MTRKTIHRENERKKNIEEIKENERSIEGERERERLEMAARYGVRVVHISSERDTI